MRTTVKQNFYYASCYHAIGGADMLWVAGAEEQVGGILFAL